MYNVYRMVDGKPKFLIASHDSMIGALITVRWLKNECITFDYKIFHEEDE